MIAEGENKPCYTYFLQKLLLVLPIGDSFRFLLLQCLFINLKTKYFIFLKVMFPLLSHICYCCKDYGDKTCTLLLYIMSIRSLQGQSFGNHANKNMLCNYFKCTPHGYSVRTNLDQVVPVRLNRCLESLNTVQTLHGGQPCPFNQLFVPFDDHYNPLKWMFSLNKQLNDR